MPEWAEGEDRVPRILLLTARPEEYRPALSALEDVDEKLHQNHPYHLWSTPRVEVRMTHTGVGEEAVLGTLSAIQGVLQPDLVLVAGTAGGLREDLAMGSPFLPTAVTASGTERWAYPSTEILEWLREIVAVDPGGEPVRTGPQVSVREPVVQRDERRRLAEWSGAMAVDMETFFVLRRLRERVTTEEFTWAGLRVISDGLDDNDPEAVLEAQQPACKRLAHHLAAFFTALEAPETWEGG